LCYLPRLNLLPNLALTVPLEHLCKMVGQEVVFSSFLPLRCMARARAVQTFWLINNGRHRLSTLRNLLEVVGQSVWLWSTDATFHKEVLNYCRHDGFPCHRKTSHGIQGVPFSYVFCGNIPVHFSHRRKHTTHLRYTCCMQHMMA